MNVCLQGNSTISQVCKKIFYFKKKNGDEPSFLASFIFSVIWKQLEVAVHYMATIPI